MNENLISLARKILFYETGGLSKVRFAKIIYFVHKGLVLENLKVITDLRFIRMPLGPVPVGFMELSQNYDFVVSEEQSSLSYNHQKYTLRNSLSNLDEEEGETKQIKKLLNQFRSLSTDYLVEHSHKEPSWKNNKNGNEYFITQEDLSHSLPKNGRSASKTNGDQSLQAKLVEGMLDDIVEESTLLEYPY